ncbi:heavy-metal-associated domain-containing protein [Candidatus Woesearchaeota archaeon]|nr:heavy-metal-associated domain-containing protein [Candidatus Woesearchaeota archaeon]
MKIQLTIDGMHCKSCKMLVTDALINLGAKNIKIDLDEKKQVAQLSLEYNDKDKIDIINAIRNEGYKVRK